jgi:DNA (cytosine-5)-methyltransferase 1
MKTISFDKFINGIKPKKHAFSFVSLFSGAGVSDYGLKLAGGNCLGACELDPQRQYVHKQNIGSKVWGDIRLDKVNLLHSIQGQEIDLVIATPPCQSFSTANARRGKHNDPEYASKDHRNALFFEALSVINQIKPKIAVFENVPNFLSRQLYSYDKKVTGKVSEFLEAALSDYVGWSESFCFSSLGLPQRRKRALSIFIRKDCLIGLNLTEAQHPLAPNLWLAAISNPPTTIEDAFIGLEKISTKPNLTSLKNTDRLHSVPVYSSKHLEWISSIPPNSGKSAWENACPNCKSCETPIFEVVCNRCGFEMTNRPHMSLDNGKIRPIKGFKTSYKRMMPNALAPTVTTSSGTFSSDNKIHPSENRVLSPRECARLQTIPDAFVWPNEIIYKKAHLTREMIGEAVPPIVTFRLGLTISKLLKVVG